VLFILYRCCYTAKVCGDTTTTTTLSLLILAHIKKTKRKIKMHKREHTQGKKLPEEERLFAL